MRTETVTDCSFKVLTDGCTRLADLPEVTGRDADGSLMMVEAKATPIVCATDVLGSPVRKSIGMSGASPHRRVTGH
jgi:hypothetical protein